MTLVTYSVELLEATINKQAERIKQLETEVRRYASEAVMADTKVEQLEAQTPRKDLLPFAFSYKNYRGDIAVRSVTPISVRFGSTEWHPEPQWLLLAFDHEKQAEREFAMKDIGGDNR